MIFTLCRESWNQDRLVGPQPPKKHWRPRQSHVTVLKSGDVLAYRARGYCFVFLVSEIDKDRLTTSPVLDALDWKGSEPPGFLRLWIMARRKADLVRRGHYDGPVWMPRRLRVHARTDADFADQGFTRVRRGKGPKTTMYTCPHGRSNWEKLADQINAYVAANPQGIG